MIDGRFVVAGRLLQTAPTDEIINEAQGAANRIWDAAGLPAPGVGLSPIWPLPAGPGGHGAPNA